MSPNKNPQIVNAGDTRMLVASINYQKLQSQDMVTWKKKIYSEDEVKENPLRLLFTIEDNGSIHSFGKELFTNYKFTKDDIGKYIKFYSYSKEFKTLAQSTVFYVEEKHDTNIRIRGVERVDSISEELYAGEKVKLKVNYSVAENKVPSKTKDNVKWMVKIDGVEERLIMNGLVIIGSEIEFLVPKEWAEKEVILMPYLYEYTEDVSVSFVTRGYLLDIKALTTLDEGSMNDKTGSVQKGMVYGKTYEFEAQFSSSADTALKDNEINWEYSFIDARDSKTITKTITGKKIKIKIDNPNMLGQELEISAYVGNKIKPNYLFRTIKQWIHYRFRWINRTELLNNANDITKKPYLVNQKNSSLCGIAFIGYHFARINPTGYLDFIKDMHRTGEAIIQKTSYTVKIDKDEHLIHLKPSDIKFPTGLADYILLVTIRDFKNIMWDYDSDAPKSGRGIEGLTGMSLPHIVKELMKDVLGFTNIIDNTNLAFSEWKSVENCIYEMQKRLKEGYVVAWFINTGAIIDEDKPIISFPDHWVGLESISVNGDIVSCRIYTWGKIREYKVKKDYFKDGNYGYIAGKR